MRRRKRIPDDPSDFRQVILPLFSIGYTAIVLLNLMRIAFFSGSAAFLWMWTPESTPLHISVISLVIVIAVLGAVMFAIIAFGERVPRDFSGKLLRAALLFFAALIVSFTLILDSGGWIVVRRVEEGYERFKDDERYRQEYADEVEPILDALRSKGP